MWPAVWTAYFFGTRGAVFIVAWIGVVHGVALLTMPPEQASVERWMDVEVAVALVVVVVRALAIRQERLIAQLAQEARVDPLTGLLNRRGFDERLALELARAARDRTWLTVVRFDIDRFKQVNDSYGHDTGDQVLAWLGGAVSEHIRGVDAAARVGGDELVVVLPRADAQAGQSLAERIRALVADGGPDGIAVSVSAGVASALAPQSSREILEEADRALYRAKATGRDRIVVGASAPT
jgi:diguanylate cyclase (GGDEF)-like protein